MDGCKTDKQRARFKVRSFSMGRQTIILYVEIRAEMFAHYIKLFVTSPALDYMSSTLVPVRIVDGLIAIVNCPLYMDECYKLGGVYRNIGRMRNSACIRPETTFKTE